MAKKETNLSLLKKLKERLLGRKQRPIKEPGIPVVTTDYSQPHVLQFLMKRKGLTHDQKVLADLSNVRLEGNFGKMVLYFCPMQDLEIVKHLKQGDGGEIPYNQAITELQAPKNITPGMYNLKNVLLHSNGVISVTETPETIWEPERH